MPDLRQLKIFLNTVSSMIEIYSTSIYEFLNLYQAFNFVLKYFMSEITSSIINLAKEYDKTKHV